MQAPLPPILPPAPSGSALPSVLPTLPKPVLPPLEHIEPLPLPLDTFQDVSWFHSFIGAPTIKSLLPVPLVVAILLPLFFLVRKTWKELDDEATEFRMRLRESGGVDYRPQLCLVVVAVVLTIQEYYGGRGFYDTALHPWLEGLEKSGFKGLKLAKYDSLYGYGWWVAARVIGYVVVPVTVWKIFFPKDSLLDYGLRVKGFFKHLWIYFALLAIVVVAMLIVSQQPDFGSYYPFYKLSSRSWADLLMWEAMYGAQFLALEFFFRGWMVGALRKSVGAAAILVMCVPYTMIHYGKPYLEAHGALIAGVVLGSLSMKTRSIYSGFLLHISVAFGMDLLSLFKRDALPSVFWAPG